MAGTDDIDRYLLRPRWVYAVQWKGDNTVECEKFLHRLWDSEASVERSWDSDMARIYDSHGKYFSPLVAGEWIVKESWKPGIKIFDREEFDTSYELEMKS